MSSVFQKHGRILLHNAILKWVDYFSVCGVVINKFVGLACSVHTPENIEQVRVAVHQESNMLSKATNGDRTGVKHYPSKNFATRHEVSSIQNTRNP
jgi:hypothetical protein